MLYIWCMFYSAWYWWKLQCVSSQEMYIACREQGSFLTVVPEPWPVPGEECKFMLPWEKWTNPLFPERKIFKNFSTKKNSLWFQFSNFHHESCLKHAVWLKEDFLCCLFFIKCLMVNWHFLLQGSPWGQGFKGKKMWLCRFGVMGLLYLGPEPWELVRPTRRLSLALRSLESHVAQYCQTRSLMLGWTVLGKKACLASFH